MAYIILIIVTMLLFAGFSSSSSSSSSSSFPQIKKLFKNDDGFMDRLVKIGQITLTLLAVFTYFYTVKPVFDNTKLKEINKNLLSSNQSLKKNNIIYKKDYKRLSFCNDFISSSNDSLCGDNVKLRRISTNLKNNKKDLKAELKKIKIEIDTLLKRKNYYDKEFPKIEYFMISAFLDKITTQIFNSKRDDFFQDKKIDTKAASLNVLNQLENENKEPDNVNFFNTRRKYNLRCVEIYKNFIEEEITPESKLTDIFNIQSYLLGYKEFQNSTFFIKN